MPLKKCPDVQKRDLRICLLQPVMTYAKKKKNKYAEKLMQQWKSENKREKKQS